jgi:hypothetical protein
MSAAGLDLSSDELSGRRQQRMDELRSALRDPDPGVRASPVPYWAATPAMSRATTTTATRPTSRS